MNPAATAGRARIDYLSAAKAVGIVLVTIGHAEPIATTFPALWKVIYSFHMPLFFFMSGFFAEPRPPLTLEAYRRLAGRQLRTLLIPYLCISLIFAVIKATAPALVNRPIVAAHLPIDILVFPSGNPALFLWFIYTLVVIRLVWPIVARMPAPLLLATLLPFQIWNIDIPLFLLGYVAYFLTYYWLGSLAGQHRAALDAALGRPLLAVLALGGFAGLSAFGATPLRPEWRLALAACGIWLTLAICRRWRSQIKGRVVDLLDRHSFDIYILQYLFIFPAFYLLRRLGVAPEAIVVVNTLFGLVGPLLLVRHAIDRAPAIALLLTGSRKRGTP